jgi:uncharacterized Fe-S cluster protein YjdI
MDKKDYPSREITVEWRPELCYHSRVCTAGLSEVFNPDKRPWINDKGANDEQIANQVNQCPSGALSLKQDKNKQSMTEIKTIENGPVMVSGDIKLFVGGKEQEFKADRVALCRCGASGKKPFCDGSHQAEDFKAD